MDLHKDLMLDTCLISSMMLNKNDSFKQTDTHSYTQNLLVIEHIFFKKIVLDGLV